MKEFRKYEIEILECIKKNNIFTVEMIFSFYSGISRSQFYEIGLNKSDTLIKALDDNKNRTKHSLLSKWYKSDNPTLQLALFKIICEHEERKSLSMNYNETKVEATVNTKVDLTKLSDDELRNVAVLAKRLEGTKD